MPHGPLETERLRLRTFVTGDFEAENAIYSRPDVARYLYEEALTEDEARAALEKKIAMDAIRSEGDGLRLASCSIPTTKAMDTRPKRGAWSCGWRSKT